MFSIQDIEVIAASEIDFRYLWLFLLLKNMSCKNFRVRNEFC